MGNDFGSQNTHLITSRIRSLSIFSLCISGTSPLSTIESLNPRVVILSDGPHSVHTPDSPLFPPEFLEWAEANGVVVLGICYGLQLIVQRLGDEVKVGEKQEYGRMEIGSLKSLSDHLLGLREWWDLEDGRDWWDLEDGGFERMVGFGGWWRLVGFQVGFDFVFPWIGVSNFPLNLNFLGERTWTLLLMIAFLPFLLDQEGSTFLALKKDIGYSFYTLLLLVYGSQLPRVAATSTVNGHLTNLDDSLSVRNLEVSAFWRCMNTAEAEDEADDPGALAAVCCLAFSCH
uniref:Glutamine amidotransferase domain-containing protein n=1 Tax=Quercus lobata TaxID=97700 RepID=A0A7N2MMT8_QUELO